MPGGGHCAAIILWATMVIDLVANSDLSVYSPSQPLTETFREVPLCVNHTFRDYEWSLLAKQLHLRVSLIYMMHSCTLRCIFTTPACDEHHFCSSYLEGVLKLQRQEKATSSR